MMDIITGKTRPDEGEVFFKGDIDLTKKGRSGNRRARHRPQVPEADRLREPYGLGQSGAGAEPQPRRLRDPVSIG
jgi:hypothetical protein